MTRKDVDSVLTIDELSQYLKIAQEGKLPGKKVGKHWRFHRTAVDRWFTEDSLCEIGRAN